MKIPRTTKFIAAHALLASLCGFFMGCAGPSGVLVNAPAAAGAARSPALEALFTVQAEGQRAVVRAITRANACPAIAFDGQVPQAMQVRAAPATVPARSDAAQKDAKPSVFDVLTCEATWPASARSASVGGVAVPAPRAELRRITVVADTGCRMKASEDAFQACNDAQKWPWAQVAQSAALTRPDVVIHIGDIHYRESPCPAGNAGCAGAPWGYGFDAWQTDFFVPAKPLLAAAPWVFVRGNHESCFRAGQGWFRFIDAQPWSEARSCNNPANDADADYAAPYAVPLGLNTQLIVFDSSKASGKAIGPQDPAYAKYAANLRAVEALAAHKPESFFSSHHPLLAFAPNKAEGSKNTKVAKPAGTAGLLSVFSALQPTRLFPAGISTALHGHLHVFEAMGFSSAHPASVVLGNSGSSNEGAPPLALPAGSEPFPGALVEDYAARAEYGFATLDHQSSGAWLLTEYSVQGVPVIACTLVGGKSRCNAIAPLAK